MKERVVKIKLVIFQVILAYFPLKHIRSYYFEGNLFGTQTIAPQFIFMSSIAIARDSKDNVAL